MSKIRYILMGLVLLICIVVTIDGTVIKGSDLTLTSSNSSGTIDLVLDEVPAGLAGYQIDINFSKEGVAEFTNVKWPAAFSMNSASPLPASSVNIVGVDLMDQIAPGAKDVTLATIGLKGVTDGTTELQIGINELTDDNGSVVTSTAVSSQISVGAKPETPVVSPTKPPQAPPVEQPSTSPTVPAPPIVPTTMPTAAPTTVPTTMPSTPEPTKAPDEQHTEFIKAAFTALPQSGTPPLTVNFTDHSSGHPTKWEWDFGDGTMSKTQNPVHVYGGIGRYTVTLKVSDYKSDSTERKAELIQVTGDYPAGPSGFVMVTSNPSEAQVYTDNRYLGTTPSTLIVPAGSKALTYKKAGYQNKTIQVDIRPNEIKLVPTVILKPIPQ